MKICQRKLLTKALYINYCLLWNAVLKLGKDNKIIQVHFKIFIYKEEHWNFLLMHEVR